MYIYNLQITRQNHRERSTVPFTAHLESNGRNLNQGTNHKVSGQWYRNSFKERNITSTDGALGQGDALLADTVSHLKQTISIDRFKRNDNPVYIIGLFGTKDIEKCFSITAKALGSYSFDRFSHKKIGDEKFYDIVPTYELMITKEKGTYYLNGGKKSLKEIHTTVGRILHLLDGAYSRGDTITRTDIRELVDKVLSTPSDISYALTNMVPFKFYHAGRTEQVRLKLMAIGEDSYAIEISSNLWGRISESNLVTYLNSYVHGSARGSWKNLSPRRLYQKLINKEPSESELRLMIAFLQQNRSADLVQKRAMSLIDDILEKYPTRVSRRIDEDRGMIYIVVRGQVNDWLLQGDTRNMDKINVGPQSVSTRQLRNDRERRNAGSELEEPTSNLNPVGCILRWTGSICINTGGRSPSMGDQFATRILSLLNDKLTVGRVSTISLEKPEYRIGDIHCPKVLHENMTIDVVHSYDKATVISNTIKVNEDEVFGMSSK